VSTFQIISDDPQTETSEISLAATVNFLCEGDLDMDGDVDGSDLAVFAADFGRTDCETGDVCEGDFDDDGDVDGSDLAVFAADFGRTDCFPKWPAPVEKTGQTTSFAPGDDGDLQMGVPWPDPRFNDNEDGTVTDNLTGLIWLKNANCFGKRSWSKSLSDCNSLASGNCGLTDGSVAGDWRLPNVKELLSLIDYGKNYPDPGLPSGHPFLGIQYVYWSSNTFEYTGLPWYVTTSGSLESVQDYDMCISVWPVRGGH